MVDVVGALVNLPMRTASVASPTVTLPALWLTTPLPAPELPTVKSPVPKCVSAGVRRQQQRIDPALALTVTLALLAMLPPVAISSVPSSTRVAPL